MTMITTIPSAARHNPLSRGIRGRVVSVGTGVGMGVVVCGIVVSGNGVGAVVGSGVEVTVTTCVITCCVAGGFREKTCICTCRLSRSMDCWFSTFTEYDLSPV